MQQNQRLNAGTPLLQLESMAANKQVFLKKKWIRQASQTNFPLEIFKGNRNNGQTVISWGRVQNRHAAT